MINILISTEDKVYKSMTAIGEQIIEELQLSEDIIAFKNIDTNEVIDLRKLIHGPVNLKPITTADPEYLDILRHDCEHVLAEAVQELFPTTKVSVGATFHNGFGYDFFRPNNESFTWEDVEAIEKTMQKIIQRQESITRSVLSYDDAIDLFTQKDEHLKVELIKTLKQKYDQFSVYTQGKFTDLCRGPHGKNTKNIGLHFKLMKISGVQLQNGTKLQRIVGTLWLTKDALDQYLHNLEEEHKRDHRTLNEQMDLYHVESHTPGMIFWHPNGWNIVETLKQLIRTRIKKQNYVEVNTPCVINAQLWQKSGHWDVYKDNMFCLQADEKTFALKPMSCPAHIAIFNSTFMHGVKSYQDLPLRIAEFGMVHRNEETGGVHGLKRARCFTQDDGHIFCTLEHIEHEIELYGELFKEIYDLFGFKYEVELSTRPEKRLGEDSVWDVAEAALAQGAKKAKLNYKVQPGEGAFYGPKLDFHIVDAMQRRWQCCTVQLDFILPERLEAKYVGQDGKRHTCVMIHRAVFGSIERFLAMLLEHTNGFLPFWLAPVKIVFVPINQQAQELCEKLHAELSGQMYGVILDDSNKRPGPKKYYWQARKALKIVFVGEKELASGILTIENTETAKQEQMKIDDFMKQMIEMSLIP